MKLILDYLATDGFFLFRDLGCRITDSAYWSAWGGTGYVVLESTIIRLKFDLDRRNIGLAIQSVLRHPNDDHWYSIGIVRQSLTDEIDKEFQPVMISPDWSSAETLHYGESSRFLEQRFDAIEALFHDTHLEATEQTLAALERQRASRLFGS
jgi:hypothetical protein